MPLLSSLETAKEEGFKKGMQTGLQRGRQEGRQEGMQTGLRQVILSMLQKKTDIAFISEVTGLSEEEIKKLQNGS